MHNRAGSVANLRNQSGNVQGRSESVDLQYCMNKGGCGYSTSRNRSDKRKANRRHQSEGKTTEVAVCGKDGTKRKCVK